MLTVNSLAKLNASSPGKMVLVQVGGKLYGLTDDLNSPRVDVVIYRGELFHFSKPVYGDVQATGERDKVAIGDESAVKSAIEKCLTDNDAPPAMLALIDPLTDAVNRAIKK